MDVYKDPHILEQGLANFFCKGPESKYFRLYGSYAACRNSAKAVTDVNEWTWLSSNKTLFIDTQI